MNFVICKHPNDSNKYLFMVPDNVLIGPCTVVAVDTCRSTNELAICISSSFKCDDADYLCKLHGTTLEKLKRVTAIFEKHTAVYSVQPDEVRYGG